MKKIKQTYTKIIALYSSLAICSLVMPTFAADSPLAPPDNTAKNERDKSGETLTSGDQGNSPEDIKISQEIRKAVVKDDTLSATGKNIKIITIDIYA